ncbi:HAMP domain-containing sensor histidine kinase [Novosphingobium sp. TH158]|uniref:sensor histidine kinase n=1 Tax=Novosphingobium sp. TH158 TaxID=2067455 RepID=UPI000C7976E6|nr:HAMP domain-containing sensor histidine kinase [Novosphingobium sp. TH158]PLK26907.1 ATP-binding protein [Novosphingobium sp. TH158]
MSEVRFRHSIFARLVLWAMLVSVGVTLLLWVVTYTTLERSSRAALVRAVDVELAAMADIHASGGQAELARRIEDRLVLSAPEGNASHYMVADNAGRRLAGDIATWPKLDARLSEAGYVTLPGRIPAYARATQLAPDLKLLVAREYGHDSALASAIGWAFLAAGAIAALAVGVIGRWRANRLAERVGRINRAFREPDEPSLEALAEGSRETDEIGELTRHTSEALAHLRRMVNAHRETTDQVAHELRTPLMHLDNRLVKALAKAQDDDDRRHLSDARAEIRHLVALLESLLDIATSEARKGDRLGLSPVNLSQLVTRVADLYADSAEESGHRFVRSIMPGITCQGEEMQLTRLITNLLDNAFKYVPAGGTVRLALEQGPVLTVSDNGPGVPEDEREHIFDRFRRGRSAARLNGTGRRHSAGLGLALARAIAERHRLTLTLAPRDKGACFIVAPETKP